MQKGWKTIFKYTLNLILAMCLVLGMPISKSEATSDRTEGKKTIILILDEVSLEEILNSDTPNIDLLLENGAMGFMNTRARSSLSNRGSTYLSLGMGVRTLASTQGGLAFERNKMYPLSDYNLVPEYVTVSDLYKLYTGKTPPDGEIINVAIGDIERTALDITPNNQVGLLGKIAREKGLVIGVAGNSDLNTSSREVTMLAMDENGVIPFGSVDSDLLTADADVFGGIKINQERLLEEVERILPHVDMLFIDYGDTARIQKTDRLTTVSVREEQKIKAIERADSFLGQVINEVDLGKTLFMVITPNPSREMVNQGNFALTPIIMSGANTEKGLLTSNTTRREGLVTNFDFGPTILNFFGIAESKSFIGEPMQAVSNENPTQVLLSNQAQILYLRNYRSVFHRSFIILVGITLVGFYLPRFTKWNGLPAKILNYLSLTVIAIPLTMMTVSLFGYKSIIFDLLYVFGGAFLIAYILNKIFRQNLMTMAILGLATSVLLLIDIYFVEKLMIISPLGSDAIAGGRFYGIGNDYMGILLGSTLLGVFSLFHLYKISKPIMAVSITSYMFLVIVALSPFFGANMGGTLSAMLIASLTLLTIFDKKFSLKKITIIVIGVIVGIILLATLDALFNPNPTHAGKALESLITGGLGKFFEIINSKLGQVFWNLIHASWNVILFLQAILMVLLYRYKSEILMKIRESYPNLFKGFAVILLGGIAIFLFNDTGTIAAALILIYLFIPLGMLVNKDNLKKRVKLQEDGSYIL
ncbi:hypothetical protein [Alkaliphilus sp. B6464]|uniref:hypothetical protein n=1 Tax=Alkaliphilus sp. B6464 TaxID=2731219 RepID=UPI001BA70634|nr:hypothetical protein [Alkaliphilus sp. B6464]QUH18651.1 hypothetical protein HYG84_01155 [Alkaliphilus sp. B6464]